MPVGGRDPASKRRHSAAQQQQTEERARPAASRAAICDQHASVCVYACVVAIVRSCTRMPLRAFS